jgi:hypothetical protein
VDKPFIESLRIKYPTTWKEMYAAYKNGHYLTIAEQLFEKAAVVKTKFAAPGTSGNDFLKKMIKKKL